MQIKTTGIDEIELSTVERVGVELAINGTRGGDSDTGNGKLTRGDFS